MSKEPGNNRRSPTNLTWVCVFHIFFSGEVLHSRFTEL